MEDVIVHDYKQPKFPVFAVLFVVLVGCVGLFSYWLKMQLEIPKTATVPAEVTTILQEVNSPAFSKQIVDLPDDKVLVVSKTKDLRQRCPVVNANFKITFDYVQNKFIVKINEPRESNKQVFDTYLRNNGFDIIPAGEFLFK